MISLKEKLSRLPPDKIADLELIAGKIIETGLAELIILYGSHARGDFKDGKIITVGGSREHPGSRVLRRSDYDILVVIDQADEEREIDEAAIESARPITIGRSELTICEKVRGLGLPVQVIVEQIDEINSRLREAVFLFRHQAGRDCVVRDRQVPAFRSAERYFSYRSPPICGRLF